MFQLGTPPLITTTTTTTTTSKTDSENRVIFSDPCSNCGTKKRSVSPIHQNQDFFFSPRKSPVSSIKLDSFAKWPENRPSVSQPVAYLGQLGSFSASSGSTDEGSPASASRSPRPPKLFRSIVDPLPTSSPGTKILSLPDQQFSESNGEENAETEGNPVDMFKCSCGKRGFENNQLNIRDIMEDGHEHASDHQQTIIMRRLAAHLRQFMENDGLQETKEQLVQKFMYQYMKAKKLDFTAAQFLADAELGDNPEFPEFGFNRTAGKNLFDELEHRVPNQQPGVEQNDGVGVIVEEVIEDGAVVPQLQPMVEPAAVQNRVEIFSKPLSPSDVGQPPGVSASLLVPKHALGHFKRFPSILKNGEVIGRILTATDINGQNWSFKMMRHQYSGSYHLRNQWCRFVRQNGLGVSFIIRFEMMEEVLHIFWEPPPQNVE